MVEKNQMGINNAVEYTDQNQMCHPEMSFPDHHMRRTMPVLNNGDQASYCAGCGQRILDRYFLMAVDQQWHMHCLTCIECKTRLDTELTCFARDGHIYCKEDYYRRFGVRRCARCQHGISANELVMRARDLVYHINCFACMSCNKTLTTGDQFGMKENLIYCRTDYEMLFQGEFFHGLSPGIPCSTGNHFPYFNGVGSVQKGRPRKRKPLVDGDGCPPGMGLMPGDNHERGGDMIRQDGYGPQPPPRQKRVRTSFKHHQLRTMKSYFSLNHNPDAKDLKQLAQKTGLSKRVLQVWFQNARAKYRRSVMKTDGDKSSGTPNGQSPRSPDPEKGKEDNNSISEMTDSGSPLMSDISSPPSLSDLQGGGTMESDHSTSSLSDLFTNSINSIS